MSLGISSSAYPTASRAAILAMGKPVAFEASADERDTRGFISITTTSSVAGLTANCTFEPPVSTPSARMTAIAWSRSIWYWRSVSVCCGATVTESPVWNPIGSTFSIEQTITTLSWRPRHTSRANPPPPPTGPPALAAHREARPDDRRQPDLGERALALRHARHDRRARHTQPRGLHRLPEQ